MDGYVSNEHASCEVRRNPEVEANLPPEAADRVREVVRLWTNPEHRGEGYATELMRQVCDQADERNVVLMLQPKPFDKNISKARLMKFYERFGFVKTQDDPVLLARAPTFTPKLTQAGGAVAALLRASHG